MNSNDFRNVKEIELTRVCDWMGGGGVDREIK